MKTLMLRVIDRVFEKMGWRKAIPTKTFYNPDDCYEVANDNSANKGIPVQDRISSDAVRMQMSLMAAGYDPAHILLLVGRIYGSVAASGFYDLDKSELEAKFFDMCSKERMVAEVMAETAITHRIEKEMLH